MKYKIIDSLDELNEKLQELNHSDDAELRVIQIKSLGKVEPLQTAPLLTYTSPQNESAAPKITSQVNAKPLIKRPVFYDVAKTIHPRLNIAYEAYHPRGAVLVDEQKTKMLVLNDFFKQKGVLFYPVDDKSANLDWLLYLCHFLLPCGILGDYNFFPLPLLKIKGGIKSELESNLDNPLVWTQYYPFGQEDFKTVNWDNGYYSADSPENKFSQLKNHRLHDVTEGNFYAIPIDTIELESEYATNPVTYKLLIAFAFPVYDGLMVFAPSVLCEKLLLYLDKKYRASAAPIEQVKKLLHQVKKSELENFENMVLPENKSVIEIIDIEKDSGRSKQIKFRISTEKENSAKEPDKCTFLELKRILVLHYVTFSSVRFILPTEKIQKVRLAERQGVPVESIKGEVHDGQYFPTEAEEKNCSEKRCPACTCREECRLLQAIWGDDSNTDRTKGRLNKAHTPIIRTQRSKIPKYRRFVLAYPVRFAPKVLERLSANPPEDVSRDLWLDFIKILKTTLPDS